MAHALKVLPNTKMTFIAQGATAQSPGGLAERGLGKDGYTRCLDTIRGIAIVAGQSFTSRSGGFRSAHAKISRRNLPSRQRKKFLARKTAFAGLSASLRMK